MRLLFPGRHHLLTNFQQEYLTMVIGGNLAKLPDVNGKPLGVKGKIDTIIWAVTSANHSNTRRNPLPMNRREIAIEKFSEQFNVKSYVYPIDDLGFTPKFAEYVLKKIEVESYGKFRLTPKDTIVGCSTPQVIEMYEKLGFKILPFELVDRKKNKYCAETPWQLIKAIVKAGEEDRDWKKDKTFLTKVAEATRKLFLKYDYGDLIIALHQDPLLGEEGDITETRDYYTYMRAFDEGAERKYALIKNFVKPGRIVDIGCCAGALIRQLTLDGTFRESDFYGIEAARRLYTECLHRKEDGYFRSDNVFFYQRNVATGRIFQQNSINTFITMALPHEIESYQGRKVLGKFVSLLHEQLAIGGRWINVDVVAPENKRETVYMLLNAEDGRKDDYDKKLLSKDKKKELNKYLSGLSTFAKFLRFAKDFRHEEGYRLQYALVDISGKTYVKLSMKDACEFMSKKDYTDNWESEMHEKFCSMSFNEWKNILEKKGFRIHPGSHEFTNPWIVENRLKGKMELYRKKGRGLEKMDYPVTTMVMIADKW